MQRFQSSDLASLGVCEGQLQKSFESTYYPLLRSVCSSCHVPGGRGSGEFADGSPGNAFGAFMSKGYTKINQVATGAHYFPSSLVGSNTTAIQGFQPQWLDAYGKYMSCMSSGGGGDTSLETLAKKGPAGFVPAVAPAQAPAYSRLQWDLETDAKSPNVGKFKALASIEVRPYYRNGALEGFEFRNPIVKLKPGTTDVYRVTGLDIGLDNVVHPDFSMFTAVTSYIQTTTDVNLAPGSTGFVQMTGISDQTQFDLRFQSFIVTQAPTPTPTPTPSATPTPPVNVTYAILSSAGNYGVFYNSCRGCHGATNPAGGLNLLDSAQAIANATKIIGRMTNNAMPMPPSGVLPQSQIDLVQTWINQGTPP